MPDQQDAFVAEVREFLRTNPGSQELMRTDPEGAVRSAVRSKLAGRAKLLGDDASVKAFATEPASPSLAQIVGHDLAENAPITASIGSFASEGLDALGIPPEAPAKLGLWLGGDSDPSKNAKNVVDAYRQAQAERPWTVGLAGQAGGLLGFIEGGRALGAVPGLRGHNPITEAMKFGVLEGPVQSGKKLLADAAGVETTVDGTMLERAGHGALVGGTLGAVGPVVGKALAKTGLPQRVQASLGGSATLSGLAAAEAPEGQRGQAAAQGAIVGAVPGLIGRKAPFIPRTEAEIKGRAAEDAIQPGASRPTEGDEFTVVPRDIRTEIEAPEAAVTEAKAATSEVEAPSTVVEAKPPGHPSFVEATQAVPEVTRRAPEITNAQDALPVREVAPEVESAVLPGVPRSGGAPITPEAKPLPVLPEAPATPKLGANGPRSLVDELMAHPDLPGFLKDANAIRALADDGGWGTKLVATTAKRVLKAKGERARAAEPRLDATEAAPVSPMPSEAAETRAPRPPRTIEEVVERAKAEKPVETEVADETIEQTRARLRKASGLRDEAFREVEPDKPKDAPPSPEVGPTLAHSGGLSALFKKRSAPAVEREKVGALKSWLNTAMDSTRQKYAKVMRADPALGGALDAKTSSSQAGAFSGRLHSDALKRMAKKAGNEKLAEHVVPYIYTERAKEIETARKDELSAAKAEAGLAAKRTDEITERLKAEGVDAAERKALRAELRTVRRDFKAAAGNIEDLSRPITIPTLGDAAMKKLAADPNFKRMLDYYDSTVLAEMESLAPIAGIKSKTAARYAKLLPLTTEAMAEAQKAGKTVIQGGGTPGTIPQQFQTKRARAASKATGTASRGYSTDLQDVLTDMMVDRYSAAYHNKLIDEVRRYALPKGTLETEFGGKTVPVRSIQVEKRKTFVAGEKAFTKSGDIRVPEPVARAYEDALAGHKLMNEQGAIQKIHSLVTGIQLATPAEGLWHAVAVWNQLATTPGIGGKNPLLRGLALTGGAPGRFLAAVVESLNVHGPEAVKWGKILARQGAVRAEHLDKPQGWFGKMLHNIPVAKQVRDKVFGMPNLDSRGFHGLETRVRVAQAQLLARRYPKMSEAEVARHVNSTFATYVHALQPEMVRMGKLIDPFWNFGLTKIKSGAKVLSGYGPEAWKNRADTAELLWSYLAVTPALLAIATKTADAILTGEDPVTGGRWFPPGVRVGEIPISYEGGVTAFPMGRAIASTWVRGMRHIGFAEMLNGYADGKYDHATLSEKLAQASMDATRGISNSMISRVGGVGRLGLALATGKAPYFTQSGELMDVAPKTAKGSQTAENAKHALLHMWSPLGEVTGAMSEGGKIPSEGTPAQQALNATLAVLGMSPRYGAPQRDVMASKGRQADARAMDVAGDAVLRFQRTRKPAKEAAKWLRDYLKERVPEEDFNMAYRTALKRIIRRPANTERYIRQEAAED